MESTKGFESVAAEPKVTVASAKELQDFVRKSQVVTVSPDVTSGGDTGVVEPDWYICGGSGFVLIVRE